MMAERDWENFFQSLIEVLDQAENVTNEQQREITGLHLEDAVTALQQVISLVPGESESGQVLATLLRNFRLLSAGWRDESSDRCSSVAIYSLDPPPVVQNVSAGRPKFEISEEVLLEFRSIGFTWTQIAEMLLVSRWTIRRRVVEFGLQDVTGYSHISDQELDAKVDQFMQRHGTMVGYSIISGHLKSLGLRVQRRRVRASIARVDPSSSRLRWSVVVFRRRYSVAGPNSLWHADGHHSLVTWGFVIHGAIDGFSRCIVYLECSTNNRSDTVAELFLGAIQNFGWPSRVRTDKGGENVGIWAMMEEFRGANRRSYLAGSSVHNQRIERLWRDVFCMVCHLFYYTFQAMEESGVLSMGDEIHKFILHFVFLPRINIALNSFVASWNNHPMRTARNWSPYRIWVNGVLDIRNHENVGVSDIVGSSTDEAEWYGYDPSAPAPSDDGLSSVEVLDADPNLPDHIFEQLRTEIDPCENSDNFGIDIYLRALHIVESALTD